MRDRAFRSMKLPSSYLVRFKNASLSVDGLTLDSLVFILNIPCVSDLPCHRSRISKYRTDTMRWWAICTIFAFACLPGGRASDSIDDFTNNLFTDIAPCVTLFLYAQVESELLLTWTGLEFSPCSVSE